jgi:hypothetical protein
MTRKRGTGQQKKSRVIKEGFLKWAIFQLRPEE